MTKNWNLPCDDGLHCTTPELCQKNGCTMFHQREGEKFCDCEYGDGEPNVVCCKATQYGCPRA